MTDELGMIVKVNVNKPNLADYDLIFIPGGMGTRKLKEDHKFMEWIRTCETVPYKVAVCTGSLILGQLVS